MFKTQSSQRVLLFILIGCILILVSPKCTSQPQCFKKLMFNFNFPEMDVYQIKSTTQINNQYMMKAYGDFNNDLFSDFIAINQQHEFLVFVWNNDLYLYQKVFTTNITNQVIPKTFYLVDISGDGRQDIVVWGYTVDKNQQIIENCLVAFVRQDNSSNNEDDNEIEQVNYDFKETARLTSNPTTDPIVIGHKLGTPVEGVGFLMVLNSTRYFIRYLQLTNMEPVFQLVEWSNLIISGDSYSNIQFLDPHWNSYVDLTGDCQPDLMIMNEKGEIEVWIGENQKFKLNKVINLNQTLNNHLVGITFNDINYDGAIDLIIGLQGQLLIYLNPHSLTIDDIFCQTKNEDVTFSQTPLTINLPLGHKLKKQALHLGDINIDGYPDLFVVLIDENSGNEIPMLYENQFKTGGSFYPFDKPNFNDGVLSTINTTIGNILSVSFIDILQNGYHIDLIQRILDMIITYQSNGKYLTKTFYNNYLCQNDYFIKGYGLLGPSTTYASQYPGMSFYWLNSVNDGYKISYSAQIIQSAYDSLQLPYAFSGLGRTNNYVESFTIGRNGIPRQWSPIIPNSQLGVFTTHNDPEEWEIRIFSFPLYELIAVIICTAVILTIFGVYLMYRKCKGYGKKQEPLQIQFIN